MTCPTLSTPRLQPERPSSAFLDSGLQVPTNVLPSRDSLPPAPCWLLLGLLKSAESLPRILQGPLFSLDSLFLFILSTTIYDDIFIVGLVILFFCLPFVACGIFSSQPGIEPGPSAVRERGALTTRSPGNPWYCFSSYKEVSFTNLWGSAECQAHQRCLMNE